MAELKRQLGLLDSTLINVGTIIASAIFIVPSTIALQLHASAPAILVWVVGGAVSLLGALAVAELGAAMPKAGGLSADLGEADGPVWGCLTRQPDRAVRHRDGGGAVGVRRLDRNHVRGWRGEGPRTEPPARHRPLDADRGRAVLPGHGLVRLRALAVEDGSLAPRGLRR